MANANRILVKLRSSTALAVVALRADLRPLWDPAAPPGGLGLAAAPAWHPADPPDGGPAPWDASHARVADQLGVAVSDVLFVEPGLPQSYPDLNEKHRGETPVLQRRTIENSRHSGRITFDNRVASYNGDFVIPLHHPPWRDDRNDPATTRRARRGQNRVEPRRA